ncbi:MAG: hypothetical protein Q9187_006386 [Circinaria calcarea]
MSTQVEVQDLLRFLARDAKIPLPIAMAKIKELQQVSLMSPACLAKASVQDIDAVFADEKLAKQVLNAAKRLSKKRPSDASPTLPSKQRRTSLEEPMTPATMEESLSLPKTTEDEEVLSKVVLYTNRAPLVLAFAVALLKYTMPDQPLSSRLSLAQAVVSVNSRSKAVSLGLEKGNSAEEDGWGQGQPKVRVMGREIRVLKRWGYDPQEVRGIESHEQGSAKDEVASSAGTVKAEADPSPKQQLESEPALWGLDLEALRTSNGLPGSGTQGQTGAQGLPIYTPQSARAYILRSFFTGLGPSTDTTQAISKKKSGKELSVEIERNLAMLLRALDLLYASWSHVLSTEELDRRAWSWYIHVRPEVQNGVAGWGGKGEVKLSDILDLRRKG